MCNKKDAKKVNLIFDPNAITRNALKKRKKYTTEYPGQSLHVSNKQQMSVDQRRH